MANSTVGRRIVVHLSRFSRFQGDYSCPPGMTQEGVSAGLDISRQHAGNELRKLVDNGLAESRSAHVNGGSRKMKVYNLTPAGERMAAEAGLGGNAGSVSAPEVDGGIRNLDADMMNELGEMSIRIDLPMSPSEDGDDAPSNPGHLREGGASASRRDPS